MHALGQCRKIIREHGWSHAGRRRHRRAAREVAELADPTVAALSPRAAADLRAGCPRRGCRGRSTTTRRASWSCRASPTYRRSVHGPVITSFVFRVRNVPAALYKALGGFATNGVNMTKLESYQLGGTFIATQFYADIEGHPDDPQVALALEELAFFSVEVRLLGVYPAHPFRTEIAEPAANRALRPHH